MVLKILELLLLLIVGILVVFGAATIVFLSVLYADKKARAEENEINNTENNSSDY